MGASSTKPSIQTLKPAELRLAAWLRSSGPTEADLPRTDEAWVALANDAAQAGLAGLVLEHAGINRVELPARCMQRLRAAAMAVGVKCLHMMRELESVVCAFNQAEVPVLLLKGAALNLTVYERADQRPMSDLDLLVEPENAHEALALLRENGCEPGYDLIRDDFFPKYHYEVELLAGGARPVRLDLHARPFRPLRLAGIMPDDAFWHQANAIRIGQAEALIPRPEFMFLHLAAHAGFHGCSRLLWLYDLRKLVKHFRPSLDWSLVLRYAVRWRLSCAVSYVIEQTEELLGPVCPTTVGVELHAHKTSWRDRWTLRQAPRDAGAPLAHVTCNLLCTPGIRLRVGYLWAHVFPGAKHLATKYPYRHRGWIGCAHLLRISRAVGKVLTLPAYAIAAAATTIGRGCARFLHAIKIQPSPTHGHGAMARGIPVRRRMQPLKVGGPEGRGP